MFLLLYLDNVVIVIMCKRLSATTALNFERVQILCSFNPQESQVAGTHYNVNTAP